MSYWGKLAGLLFVIGCSTGGDPAHVGGHKTESDAATNSGAVASEARVRTTAPEVDGGSVTASEDASTLAPLLTAGQSGSVSSTPVAGSGGAGAAGSNNTGAAGSGGTPAAIKPAAGSGGPEPTPSGQGIKASDEVFRDELLRTYALTFSDADWKKLQETAAEEIYVPATLRVEGELVGKMALRDNRWSRIRACGAARRRV
jgi:hypothetical protein